MSINVVKPGRGIDAGIASLGRVDILDRTLHLIDERRTASATTDADRIARENRAAARSAPPPSDPRLAMVSEIRSRLQGSLLAPEDRRDLLAAGRSRGLRAFDTSLLIALVQDRARRAGTPRTDAPSRRTEASASGGVARSLFVPLLAGLGALALAGLGIAWILGGA